MALPLCHALQDQLGVLGDCPLNTIDSLGPVHIGLQLVVSMRVVLSGLLELIGHTVGLEIVIPLFHHLTNQCITVRAVLHCHRCFELYRILIDDLLLPLMGPGPLVLHDAMGNKYKVLMWPFLHGA